MANNDIKLSILICSVQDRDREENLKNIEHELKDQICKNYAENIVEILIEKDNREMSVGRKRNVLIDKAKGEYVCFIDDDDFISKDYLNIILDYLNFHEISCILQIFIRVFLISILFNIAINFLR